MLALRAKIQIENVRLTCEFYEICYMLIDLGLNAKQEYEDNGNNYVKQYSWGCPINQHVLNFNDSPCFDSISYQENFINWTLDLEHYFAYANIPEYFNV